MATFEYSAEMTKSNLYDGQILCCFFQSKQVATEVVSQRMPGANERTKTSGYLVNTK